MALRINDDASAISFCYMAAFKEFQMFHQRCWFWEMTEGIDTECLGLLSSKCVYRRAVLLSCYTSGSMVMETAELLNLDFQR